MATYVNDLRLKEIGTGESSGTWGTETNTNLELIGEALGFGTEAITTNADTHTTTVADGSTDPGRAMYLKYTGTLDSACTITIAPNTMSRMHFIENGTSGSQNIIISQGTGANVTIPAGDVKAVYLDGAGSGAAVADAFASLNVVDLKVEDDLTITDDLTFSSDSAVVTFGADGDTTLTHTDGTGLTLNSTNKLCFNDASQFIQGSSATVLSLGATDEIDLTATAIDVNGTMDVSGAITSSAGATITVSDNSDNLTLTSTDADANSGPNLRLYRNSSSPADDDVVGVIDFEGRNNNSQDVIYANIQGEIMQEADGSEDGQLQFGVMKAGTLRNAFMIDRTEVVINEDSVDIDFRVESNGDANMLVVDAGNDKVGMGISTPSATLDVRNSGGTDTEAFISVGNSDASKFIGLYSGRLNNALPTIFADSTSTRIRFAFADDNVFGSGFAEEMALFPNGQLGIGSSPTNLTTEVINVSTPASGGGTGISFKRLDTNTDQVVGQIRFSNNSTDDLAFIKAKTDGANTSSAIQFFTNTGSGVGERMRINSTGVLSIGSTTTKAAGDNPTDENSTITGPGYLYLQRDDNAEINQIVFGKDGQIVGRVVTTTATSYVSASDYRMKENVDYTWDATSRLKQLKPARYNWIADETNTLEDGFLAHEVSSVVPHAVFGEKDGDTMQGVDYAKMTPLLTKALQELEARVTTLEG